MLGRIGYILIVVSLGLAGQAAASNDTWTNASGDSLWSNPANWSSGKVPTNNDTAIFDPTFSNGGSIIDLGGIWPEAADVNFNSTTDSTVFDFRNGTLVTTGIGSSAGAQIFSANISTMSSFLFLSSAGNSQYAGVIGANGALSDFFNVNINGGTFTGANTYNGTTSLSGFAVPVVITGADGSIRASSSINIYEGNLELDNRPAVNSDRLGDNAPINCVFGTITLDGNATAATSETIGAVTLSGTKLNLNVHSNGAPASMTLQSLTRSGAAVLELSLDSSATTMVGQALVRNAASLPLVGSSGSPGSTNQSILPYAIGTGGSFITYDPGPDGKLGTADDVGLRPLDFSTEYLPAIPLGASSTSNIRITANQTLSQSTTVNALAISNATLTIPASQQIQLTSGALSMAGTSSQITAISGGVINFGSHEALIYTDGQETGTEPRYVVDSQLQNASSITKFGAGTLVLTQPSSFAGTLTISEGIVVSQANGALGSGNILVGDSPQYGLPPAGIAFENSNQTFSNNISQVLDSSSPITVNVAGGIVAAYSGTVTGPLLKNGPGTLWLTHSSSVVNPNGAPSYVFQGGTVRVDTTAHANATVGLGTGGPSAVLGGSGTLDLVQLFPSEFCGRVPAARMDRISLRSANC